MDVHSLVRDTQGAVYRGLAPPARPTMRMPHVRPTRGPATAANRRNGRPMANRRANGRHAATTREGTPQVGARDAMRHVLRQP